MIFVSERIETRDNREDLSALRSTVNQICQNTVITSFLDAIPIITLLLNDFRQVVYCNRAYLELTFSDPKELVLGLRTGELFGCAYHNDSIDGCGESEHCRYCEAVATIREAQIKQSQVIKEARLILIKGEQEISVDFKVAASPFRLNNENYMIVTLEDIGDNKRRKVLERIFFHDIIDKASSLQFAIDAASTNLSEEQKKYMSVAQRLSHELISEILGQRVLMNAENNELKLNLSTIFTTEIIQRSIDQIKNHQVSNGKSIIFNGDVKGFELITDYLLLNRVLINMLKNALEDSLTGEEVTISCFRNNNNIEFSVHNIRAIQENIKAQIFQRSFSTKGANRGIGTYSMKLLGENCLKGRVWFESAAKTGTVFYLSIPQVIS